MRQFIIIFVAILLISLVAFKLYANKKEINRLASLPASAEAFPVKIVAASYREALDTVSVNGVIRQEREIEVLSEQTGVVLKKYKNAGDSVREGEVIALIENKLESENYRIALADLNTAKKELERAKSLWEKGAVAANRYDAALTAFNGAKANEAALKRQLENKYIKAPVSGVLDTVYIEEGSFITSGSPAAYLLTGGLKLVALVTEKDVVKLSQGKGAVITFDSFPDTLIKAKITRIALSSSSYSYTVELSLEGTSLPLRSGMYGDAEIDLELKRRLMIPFEAVEQDASGARVFVLVGDTAEKRDVNLGRRESELVEVLSGVAEGENVATEGRLNLTEGAKVILEGGQAPLQTSPQ